MERSEPKQTPWVLVALAWFVVATPLAWGVSTSIKKALPLFQTSSPLRAKP